MRPLQLRLQAFGSYPGAELIDFESLAPRGLFLVSGDTGAGKTTIFDAMCWALYGDMPGKNSKEVRSHHVADEVRTEVSFTFECDGERYTVIRNPEQLRPQKRSTGYAREAAAAQLIRHIDGGTESTETRATDVARRCTELIGLDSKQFQRVILLPQGEFSRFLLADTTDREGLLGQLFGGHVYDRIVEVLKAERDRRSEELGTIEQDLAEALNIVRSNIVRAAGGLAMELPDDLESADRGTLSAWITEFDQPVGELRSEVQRLQVGASTAADRHRTAQAEADRYHRAVRQRAELDRLAALATGIHEAARSAELSAHARPVVDAATRLNAARTAATRSAADREDRLARIRATFATVGVEADTSSAAAVIAQLTELQARADAGRDALAAVTEARHQLTEATAFSEGTTAAIATTKARRSDAAARMDETENEVEQTRPAAVDVTGIDSEIERTADAVTARSRLEVTLEDQLAAAHAATEATAEHERLLAAFVSTQAPRLAATLTDGEPCPVCGSDNHPAPAGHDGAAPTTFEQVQQADARNRTAQQQAASLATEVATLRSALGHHADTPVDELRRRVQDLTTQRRVADEAHSKLATLATRRTTLDSTIQQATAELAKLEERSITALQEVQRRTEALDSAQTAADRFDHTLLGHQRAAIEALADPCNGLEDCLSAARSAADLVKNAQQTVDTVLATSGFETLDAATAVLLDAAVEDQHREALANHERELANINGALEVLQDQGIPDQPPDLATSGAIADQADQLHQERASVLQTVSDAVTYASDALATHDRVEHGAGDKRRAAEAATRAHRVVNSGGATVAMSLKRWVLTRELDRVTAAANVHLGRMTGQRYVLRRTEDRHDARKAFGLELEVLDAQTGRARSTSSLSGGEQFQASLALALGLADVVSHGGAASGKTFDALFVDEGFGSLSSDALDDAIDTLHQLHATGRMVGAITHVDAMKEQLHVGIEVKRRPDGDGSTVVVHP